jgi:hypothetical protein
MHEDSRLKEGACAERKTSFKGSSGILHRPGMRPVSVEEMDEAIGRHLAEDDERIQKGRA